MRKVIAEQITCDATSCGREINEDEEELMMDVEVDGIEFVVNVHTKRQDKDACMVHHEMALQLASQKILTKYDVPADGL